VPGTAPSALYVSRQIGAVQEVITEVAPDGGGARVLGVRVGEEVVSADTVVVAMGPWSKSAARGLQLPVVLGQKYHSVLMRNARELSEAVFFQGLGDPEASPARLPPPPRPNAPLAHPHLVQRLGARTIELRC
jgi:hypothetical protein